MVTDAFDRFKTRVSDFDKAVTAYNKLKTAYNDDVTKWDA